MLNIIHHPQGLTRVSSTPSLTHSNSSHYLFSMLNSSSNQVSSTSSSSSQRGGVSMMETSTISNVEHNTTNTNWYHVWAFLAILLDYVSVIFNVFPVNSIENAPNNMVMTNEDFEQNQIMFNSIQQSSSSQSLTPPSSANHQKNSLEVLASEFYSSLFASGGIESNENFERMVNSLSGNLIQRHGSIYSQTEYSEDESTIEPTVSSKQRYSPKVAQEQSFHNGNPEQQEEQLKSNLNLFKFPPNR